MSEMISIASAIERYLDSVKLSRSSHTARTYGNALASFRLSLAGHKIDVHKLAAADLSEDAVSWFSVDLKDLAPATERLYLTAVTGFYEYLAAERLASPNLPRVRLLIKQSARRPGQRLPQFPRNLIADVVSYAINLATITTKDERENLRNLRDRAFLITLADTGLRVHEACRLRRGDMDWNEGKAVIIGKGNQQAVVRFSRRSMEAIQDYLKTRATLDGASRKPLSSLPLFARHDKGAGKKVKGITTDTGRDIVKQRVTEAVGAEAAESITPHSFRHYFVTTVLFGSGGNLKMAQALARHKNIAVTQRYAHLSDDELDQGYWQVFEEDER